MLFLSSAHNFYLLMNLPYFYEPSVSAAPHFILSEETSRHCIQVLRMKAGEQLNLTDGKGNLYTAAITKEDKKFCEVTIKQHAYRMESLRKVCVAISLLKNTNRFEWFLEKATEIGAFEIMPLLCERTEREHFRYERMNAILTAAMLQSQQCRLPLLNNPVRFTKAVKNAGFTKKFIAHCAGEDKRNLYEIDVQNNVQILIGPEGDFTFEEIQLALQNDFIPVALGNTRLRTETAGVVALALLINKT